MVVVLVCSLVVVVLLSCGCMFYSPVVVVCCRAAGLDPSAYKDELLGLNLLRLLSQNKLADFHTVSRSRL